MVEVLTDLFDLPSDLAGEGLASEAGGLPSIQPSEPAEASAVREVRSIAGKSS